MRIGEANRNNYPSSYRPMQTASQYEPAGPAELQGNLPSAAAPAQDTVTITANEKQRLKKEARQKQLQDARQELDSFQRLLESSHEQAKAAGEAARIRMKCMVIASRIMSGDKVPREDYRYLAKNDPELYGKALTMRFERDKPKKHDRLSEEEEEEGTVFSSSSVKEEHPLPMDAGAAKLTEEASQ